MSTLKFAKAHNMVMFLEKPTESEGFEQIIDFLNASCIRYALTVNPIVYVSSVDQFWMTAQVKKFNDEGGIDGLPNATIFKEITRMGYERLTQKLSFYKAFFSPQWKFMIHTFLQCLSAKTTTWNEFSSTVASAIICLSTNQRYNYSKFILEGMIRNLDLKASKFLMYPRFI
ncbi:hypothetical protein Tco_0977489 [Tanacetum coccineum]|uniref:Uncharacterized protein n=1 Tax=Tanacetum coccineum TaxID=301880 RepID=A0ABQ5EKG2_9ASTR